jgi:dipeptide/tripeptide permease
MSDPVTKTDNRLPPQTKFIVGNEACERFSYYGIRSILAGYITGEVAKGGLDQSADTSTSIIHLFIFANYFMPLFGAWLSDKLIGRYYTILYVSLIYCLGNGVLACSDVFTTVDAKMVCLCAGLALIAFGSGGIKPCVSAFMGDQFKPEQSHLLQKAYGAFYWAINFGSFFSFLVVPAVKNHRGYGWAFGVPGILMALATLIFYIGTRHYTRIPPARQTKTAGFLTVFLNAFRSQARLTPGPVLNILVSLVLPLVAMVALTIVALSGASTFSVGDVKDLSSFSTRLRQHTEPVSQFLWNQLSETTRDKVAAFSQGTGENRDVQAALLKEINALMASTSVHADDRFAGVTLSQKTSQLLAQNVKELDRVRLNRMLLEDAYPQEITRKSFGYELTPLVRAIGWAALYGVGLWYALIVVMSLAGRLELPDKFWLAARARHKETEIGAAQSVSPILFVFSLVPVFWALFDQTTSTWVLQGETMVPLELGGWYVLGVGLALAAAQVAVALTGSDGLVRPVMVALGGLEIATGLLALLLRGPGTGWSALVGSLTIIVIGTILLAIGVRGLPRLVRWALGAHGLIGLVVVLVPQIRNALLALTFTVGAEEMQSANPLLVMVLVPLLTLAVYPRLGRLATPLRRMGAGMFFGAASYVIVAWLQQRLTAGAHLSVLWQFVPYTVLTTGEVLLSTTGLEFAFAEAAPEMRSTIMSFWLLTVAFGNLVVTGITKLMSGGAAHAGSVSASRFLLYAGMTAVVAVLFSMVAARYRYRHPAFKALVEKPA